VHANVLAVEDDREMTAAMRRPASAGQRTVGDLEIDPDRLEVRRSGGELLPSTKEQELLVALARRAGPCPKAGAARRAGA